MNDHIKQYAQKWVNNILEKYEQKLGFSTPPVYQKTLCSIIEELHNIKITLQPDDKISTSDEGLLVPVRGGFIIKYGTFNKNQKRFHEAKIRETICHELSHMSFYDCTSIIPQLKVNPPEYLCHDMARQMLLPDRIIRKMFSEKIKINSNLIWVIEELSKEFQVAPMLVIRKVIEDLALLTDTMVTLWKYKSEYNTLKNEISYDHYRHDPKLTPQLRKLLPKYWRDQIHIEAWEKVVSKYASENPRNVPDKLRVEGKRKKGGRIKTIQFEIQCERIYDRSNNLNFNWSNNINPPLLLISVKKFNLHTL